MAIYRLATTNFDNDPSGLEDPIDPVVTQETIFGTAPSVGDFLKELARYPKELPVYVNGEGWLTTIELVDPTNAEPFQAVTTDLHVVIG